MFERFLRREPIDIPRRVVDLVGNVLGISALVAFIIGPTTAYLYQCQPGIWRIVVDYHFLVVVLLLLIFSILGHLVAMGTYSATRWTLATADRRLLSWLSHDMGRALALFGGAALAALALTFVFGISWSSGGSGLPDAVGLIDTGFTFLIAVGLNSALHPYGFRHPERAKRVIPIGGRELAWCVLTLETSIAVAVGSFTYFAFVHQDELASAGLSELWIWAGLVMSAAILAGGIILFFRLFHRGTIPPSTNS